MKKNDIKLLITFAIGVGAGALVTNHLLRLKYEMLVQNEIDSVKKTFGINSKNFKKAVNNNIHNQNIKDRLEYNKLAEVYTNANRVRYNSVNKEIDYETSDEAYGDKSVNVKPYVIDVNAFMDERPHYDKISLHYYTEDDTLSDEREEIIADPNILVGEGMLLNFGSAHLESNPDVLYIRNENITADFEVICVLDSYSVSILGMETDHD